MKFLNLKDIYKNNSEIFNQAIKWLGSLTKEVDFEDGKKFVQFIEKNMYLNTPLGVFILFDPSQNQVIGVVSLIIDDQGVGKEYNLPGIWIAGVNIHRDYRGKGYGKILFNSIDSYLQNLLIPNLQTNLFTNNPVAIKLYEKFNFKNTGLKVERHNVIETVFSKIYN